MGSCGGGPVGDAWAAEPEDPHWDSGTPWEAQVILFNEEQR